MRQFLKFLLSGGLAAFLNWSSRMLFSMWLPYETAIVLAFFVGLTSGFIIMRRFVFRGQQKSTSRRQALNYFIVNMLALAQTFGISVALVRWGFPSLGILQNTEALAHLIGVLTPVVTSYFGHKYFTFR